MALILKNEANTSVPTPDPSKTALFIDTSGNLSLKNDGGTVSVFSATPGSNTQVVFNDAGALGANANFVFNKATSNLTVTGNVIATLVGGTLTTAAQPNITSVGSLTSLTVTGNASAGNISTTGVLSVTGNSNVGNLGTAGLITATGNISGGNLLGVFAGGNSNITITSNANITAFVAGNATARFTVTSTGANITGTLNATGNANVGNLGATNANVTAITATGNANVGNIGATNANLTALTATGNANVGNIGATNANLTALTATGNANVGNIGATNANVTAITATGNANVGNLGTGGLVVATGNVTGGNLNTGGIVSATGNVSGGNLTTTGVLTVTGTGVSSIGGNLDMTSNTIINLATPTNSTDAATKQYVDDVAQGLNVHDAAYAATTNTLTVLTGGTITYNNGSSGVGANLTLSGTPTKGFLSANTFDGNTTAVATNRILVKNEANAVTNGIYVVTSNTVLTRATDYDSVPEVEAGDFVFVTDGDTYNDTGWVQTSTVTAIGTAGNNITFTQFSGAGTYTAGTGLTLTGTQFSVNASQTQITAVGTLTSLTVSGNASAGNISTAGVLSVTGNANVGNIGATNANVTAITATGNANVGNLGTGGLITATGNITGGNLIGPLASGNSNITITSNANISLFVAGNATARFVATTTGVNVAGTLNATGNANVGNIGATNANVTAITATGNANVGNIGATNANVTAITATGNANVGNIGATNANVTAITATGNANVGNLGTGGLIVATGNVTGGNLVTAGVLSVTGNGNLGNVGATRGVFTNIAGEGGNISNIQGGNVSGAVSSATTAGTVTTAAQPNITSVGTLTGLGVNGTITAVNITANTGVITGNANGISSVQAGNIVGTILGATVVTSSLTSVGTLTSLNVSGTVTAPNFTANTGYFLSSVGTGISAAGATQATGTALVREINVVSTVTSGANGVTLPTAVAGYRITIINTSANALNVYPLGNGIINSQAANTAYSQAAGARLDFICTAAATAPGGQWYTLNATYA